MTLPPDPSMPKDSSEPHSFSPREKSPRYRPLGTHRHYRADSADSVDEQTVHRRASAHPRTSSSWSRMCFTHARTCNAESASYVWGMQRFACREAHIQPLLTPSSSARACILVFGTQYDAPTIALLSGYAKRSSIYGALGLPPWHDREVVPLADIEPLWRRQHRCPGNRLTINNAVATLKVDGGNVVRHFDLPINDIGTDWPRGSAHANETEPHFGLPFVARRNTRRRLAIDALDIQRHRASRHRSRLRNTPAPQYANHTISEDSMHPWDPVEVGPALGEVDSCFLVAHESIHLDCPRQ
ncbi:hypothetical protein X978_288 [Burkholderia pseudomallei MSHR3965]|nr:hypothetical protein DP55_3283 [Burkholderia pseudomallei]AIV84286.1 hypothetical protein X978_288 [Burkholderia pseudomallei MSHR3965]